jgi:periplasmic protein TonB
LVPTAAPPAPAAPPPPPPPPVAKRPNPIPKGNPGNWANTNDYPSRALQQEREGTTGFRVTVGANGRVTDCSITSSSGHPDLDQATCSNVTRRARFDPALDGSGNPTTGSYSNRVRWQIPK